MIHRVLVGFVILLTVCSQSSGFRLNLTQVLKNMKHYLWNQKTFQIDRNIPDIPAPEFKRNKPHGFSMLVPGKHNTHFHS